VPAASCPIAAPRRLRVAFQRDLEEGRLLDEARGEHEDHAEADNADDRPDLRSRRDLQ
jgi:hypothetical protein